MKKESKDLLLQVLQDKGTMDFKLELNRKFGIVPLTFRETCKAAGMFGFVSGVLMAKKYLEKPGGR